MRRLTPIFKFVGLQFFIITLLIIALQQAGENSPRPNWDSEKFAYRGKLREKKEKRGEKGRKIGEKGRKDRKREGKATFWQNNLII